jgi:hypothetical protein
MLSRRNLLTTTAATAALAATPTAAFSALAVKSDDPAIRAADHYWRTTEALFATWDRYPDDSDFATCIAYENGPIARAGDAAHKAICELAETPAETWEGLAAKLAVVGWFMRRYGSEGGPDGPLALSCADDAARLAGQHGEPLAGRS